MKATISQLDFKEDALWEGEVLKADWDNNKGEFVIRGRKNYMALSGVVSSMVGKRLLTIEIEGNGPGLLVWRGFVRSANFQVFESGQVECSLSMLLDDWFGVLPKSAIPTPLDVVTRTRLYQPLLPP